MPTLRVHDILKDRILMSRESARQLEASVRSMLVDSVDARGNGDGTRVFIDFVEVEGMAPSFLDELLSVFDSVLQGAPEVHQGLTILNPPTRLSSKFEAVARGHDMSIQANDDGSWTLGATTGAP